MDLNISFIDTLTCHLPYCPLLHLLANAKTTFKTPFPMRCQREKQDRHSFMSCLLGIEFVVVAIRLRLAEAGEAAEREAEGLSARSVLVDDDTATYDVN
jgi:hypothetical protein